MFYELDFSQWQSYLVVLVVVGAFAMAFILFVFSLLYINWWMMGDIIAFKREMRRKRIE